MRGKALEVPEDWDEYFIYIARVASRCEPDFGAMGVVGFLYASVKDSLRDEKMSVKRFRKKIMSIGRLLSLSDKDFNKAAAFSNSISVESMTEEQINELAGV